MINKIDNKADASCRCLFIFKIVNLLSNSHDFLNVIITIILEEYCIDFIQLNVSYTLYGFRYQRAFIYNQQSSTATKVGTLSPVKINCCLVVIETRIQYTVSVINRAA